MTTDGKCAICEKSIKIELQNIQMFYDQAQKCVSREENINKITQCVIQSVYSQFETLTSKKNKKQSDRQTAALRKIFRDKIQEEVFRFVQAVQSAGQQKNYLRKNYLISIIAYITHIILNNYVFISKLELKKLFAKKIVRNIKYGDGRRMFRDIMLNEHIKVPHIQTEIHYNTQIKSVINRIILSDCFDISDTHTREMLSKHIAQIAEEVRYIHDNIIFKPFCTRQTIVQLVVFILYKFWNVRVTDIQQIRESPEAIHTYMFGKKREIPVNNTHFANKYCQILGINATVFIRRVGSVMGFIDKLAFTGREVQTALSLPPTSNI